MTFLSPWALFGLAALAIPLLVHLVRREDREGHAFASLMFLQRVPVQVRQRRKLHHRWLLLMRCLALALVALAFATPFFPHAITDSPLVESSHDVVIAVDRSYSMQPAKRWSQAMDAAKSAIKALDNDSQAALLAFDTQALVTQEFTEDQSALLNALDTITPKDRATAYPGVFNLASRLFSESGASKQTLIVVTDMQASAFSAQTLLRLDENVELQILPVTELIQDNLAVMDLSLSTDSEDRSAGTLNVLIQNTGDSPVSDRTLTLVVDDEERTQAPVTLNAGETQTRQIPIVLASDRVSRVSIGVGDDAIAADNTRHAVVSQGRRVRVGLVNGDDYRPEAGLFLQQAINLSPNAHLSLNRLRISEWLAQTSDPYDVIVLDDVDTLGQDHRRKINDALARGRGVVSIAATAPTFSHGATNNRQSSPVMIEQNPARIRDVDPNHPLAAVLDRQQTRGLLGAQVFGYRPLTTTDEDTVIARLDNGSPLLIERSVGSGRLLVFATTLDPRWSSLALEPGFVPLVLATIDHAAQRESTQQAFVTGETIDIARYAGGVPGAERWRNYLDNAGKVTIETPNEREVVLNNTTESTTASHLYLAEDSGFYEVHGSISQNLVIAVNSPRSESNTTSLTESDIIQRVSRTLRSGETTKVASTDSNKAAPKPDTLRRIAVLLLLLAFILFIAESWIANKVTRTANEVPAT